MGLDLALGVQWENLLAGVSDLELVHQLVGVSNQERGQGLEHQLVGALDRTPEGRSAWVLLRVLVRVLRLALVP